MHGHSWLYFKVQTVDGVRTSSAKGTWNTYFAQFRPPHVRREVRVAGFGVVVRVVVVVFGQLRPEHHERPVAPAPVAVEHIQRAVETSAAELRFVDRRVQLAQEHYGDVALWADQLGGFRQMLQVQPGRFAAHFRWEKTAGEPVRLVDGGILVDGT